MTTHPTAAAGSGLPEPTLDTIGSDLLHLYHLLDAAVSELTDAPRSPEMAGQFDRLAAFLWISRDMAQAAVANLREARP